MKAYIHAGLLLSVLIHTDYSAEASSILRRLPGSKREDSASGFHP